MGINGLSSLLLMVCDGFEKAVEVLVCTVIVALEGIKAIGQINPKLRWIVPFQR